MTSATITFLHNLTDTTPRLWIWRPSPGRQWDFNPPDLGAAQHTLWRGLTSRARASPATAPRLPDADPPGTAAGQTRDLPVPVQGASSHARVCDRAGPGGARARAPLRVAFRLPNGVGTRGCKTFAAQWLACTLPCRRFADTLADACARLGADADRYAFIAGDFHPLLLAGLPAHSGSFTAAGWVGYGER